MLKDYKLTRLADRDLEEICDYTAVEWGERQAVKYLQEIETALQKLLRDPLLGRQRPDLDPDLLFHRCGEHYIIYGYDREYLLVARILHVSRDINAHLG